MGALPSIVAVVAAISGGETTALMCLFETVPNLLTLEASFGRCERGSMYAVSPPPSPSIFDMTNAENYRCSATPVRRTPSAPLRFVAAAHAVMPWAFPGYHDESHAWLNFIDESHVRYYAELRDVSVVTFGKRCNPGGGSCAEIHKAAYFSFLDQEK